MSAKERLISIAEECPPELLEEAADFLMFLKARRSGRNYDALLLSYDVLAKDWLSPEEDAAWEYLQSDQS
jgi:hypothetical protein